MRPEAEIRLQLEKLRKQYEESYKNPVSRYGGAPYGDRYSQIQNEGDWLSEMAVLEWVLNEKPHLRTSWMR